MLKITLSFFGLLFFLVSILESKSLILASYIGGILIFFIVIIEIILIFLFVVKIIRWIEIINNTPNPINTPQLTNEMRELIGQISFFISIGGPIFILGYQTFFYLKNGFWESLSIIDVLKLFEINWANWPSDWQGLWKVLNLINISIPICIIFLLISFIAFRSQGKTI